MTPRIESGGFRELGPFGWTVAKIGARVEGVPVVNLFTTLGQHKRLFKAWLPYSGVLLGLGKLRRRDSELVILRVGHLRDCAYELQHHRRMAKAVGIDAETQDKIFVGPDADGLTDRDKALLTAVDEFIGDRVVSPATWQWLGRYLDRAQLIEFLALAGNYDGLAAMLNTLEIALDWPE